MPYVKREDISKMQVLSKDLAVRCNKLSYVLVHVIQWLDENGHSNTKIREEVDTIINKTDWEDSIK